MADPTRSDGQLLRQFVTDGTEAPFEELVRRHSPFVLGLCRRALGQTQDAEDAAQAAFMTLALKARSLQGRSSISGWLHHVAWNVCQHARRSVARDKAREREVGAMQPQAHPDDAAQEQLRAVLDRELDDLPESYRQPLILHYLEGLTQAQTAQRLGCPTGTLSARLNRGRELLRQRLERRGLSVPAAALTLALTQFGAQAAEVPAAFVAAASKAAALTAAGGAAAQLSTSSAVSALTQSALRGMLLAQSKVAATILLTLGLMTCATVLSYRATAPQQAQSAQVQAVPVRPVLHAGPGVVSGIKVLSNHVPDVSSLEAWAKSFIRPDMSAEEKALAIWKSVWTFQHQDDPPCEFVHNEAHVCDPIKLFNVYGYTNCGATTAHVQALARHIGLPARGWTVRHHVIPEVYYDEAWHLLDSSLVCYFRREDGPIASVDDVLAAVSDWYFTHPDFRNSELKLREYQAQNNGWQHGPTLLLRNPTWRERGWLPRYTHGWYNLMQEFDGSVKFEWEPGYSQGYQVNIQLRPGERLTRNWSNRGLHVNMRERPGPFCLEAKSQVLQLRYSAEEGDLASGRVGNGQLQYDVPLANAAFRKGALAADNLACSAEDGRTPALHLADHTRPGELIIRMPSSYLYLDGELSCEATVAAGGLISVSFSDNHGLDWRPLGTLSRSGTHKLDLSDFIFRRYDYRIRFRLQGAGTGLDAILLRHDLQHSQRVLPALNTGENKISFSSGVAEGTLTLEPSFVPEHQEKQLYLADFHPVLNNVDTREARLTRYQGSVTFPIQTPGDMTRLRLNLHYRARDERDGWDLQISFDDGKSFKTFDSAPGPTARAVKQAVFSQIPPGTRSALLRLAGVQKVGSATMIMGLRIDADYREPQGGFRPVKISYAWEEEGQTRQHVHVARTADEQYAIHCQRKPVMKSIALELAE